MRTTVVIGTHNGESYFARQLESVQSQSLSPDEILVSDDNSSDSTFEIAASAAQMDSRIRLLRNDPALGFSENFLRAAGLGTGDLIAFCDQDDVWDYRKLEKCVQPFSERRVVLVVHSAVLIDSEGRSLGPFSQGIYSRNTYAPLTYSPWRTYFGFSMVFRRDLLTFCPTEARGVDFITGKSPLSHDRWIMFLANLCGYVVTIPDALVSYRQHSANLFGAKSDSISLIKARRTALASRAKRYINSANSFLQCVSGADESVIQAAFPCFNQELSIQFLNNALMNQRSRLGFYQQENFLARFIGLSNLVRKGTYKAKDGFPVDIRALLRDVTLLV